MEPPSRSAPRHAFVDVDTIHIWIVERYALCLRRLPDLALAIGVTVLRLLLWGVSLLLP